MEGHEYGSKEDDVYLVEYLDDTLFGPQLFVSCQNHYGRDDVSKALSIST